MSHKAVPNAGQRKPCDGCKRATGTAGVARAVKRAAPILLAMLASTAALAAAPISPHAGGRTLGGAGNRVAPGATIGTLCSVAGGQIGSFAFIDDGTGNPATCP